MTRILLLCGALLFAACGDDRPVGDGNGAPTDAAPATVGPADIVFAPELEVDLGAMTRLENGVYILDISRGGGAPADSGTAVTIHYKAWLPDGTLFEERPSRDGFGASEFVLGENAPVPGLNSALEGMRSGGVRRVVVPPELGYDLIGRPEGVPADATVVFEISLRRVAS